MQLGFPAGMFEESHGNLKGAARRELSEEAKLRGGVLIPLLDNEDSEGSERGNGLEENGSNELGGVESNGVGGNGVTECSGKKEEEEVVVGGISQDKYSRNRFYPFLCLDCVKDEKSGKLDEEEWIRIRRGVGLKEVRRMIGRGMMNMPSAFLGMMALDRLRTMGFDTE